MLAKDCSNKGGLNRCQKCGAEWVCPAGNRYFLSVVLGSEKVEREVTVEEFCKAERAAGFRPKLPSSDRFYMVTPATGGFSSGASSGRAAAGVQVCPECGPVTKCHGASEAKPCPVGELEALSREVDAMPRAILPPEPWPRTSGVKGGDDAQR